MKIGVFGHYGNRNLGDESIIEAMIGNLRHHIPGCEIVCLSMDPEDSRRRHAVDAFPIRYRHDYFHPPRTIAPATEAPQQDTVTPAPASHEPATGIKSRIKAIPVLGPALKGLAGGMDTLKLMRREVAFLKAAKGYLADIDLLLVTGSNQFLDNFGGAWGFPYTLLKWTLLARATGTRVAFASIGAGPLTRPLSYRMLRMALKRADYVSFRDEGSRELIRDRVGIDGPVYPDIAHSLHYEPSPAVRPSGDSALTIAVNPMPVYDRRYWHQPDDERYSDYVNKLAELCQSILQNGHRLLLFSTQKRDEDVIDDILEILAPEDSNQDHQNRLAIARSSEVAELMATLDQADMVVATRFHATVLPLQLGKPVLGICYYRKAAELLDDVGLGEFHVSIDSFDAPLLSGKLKELVRCYQEGSLDLSPQMARYRAELDQQYRIIAELLKSPA